MNARVLLNKVLSPLTFQIPRHAPWQPLCQRATRAGGGKHRDGRRARPPSRRKPSGEILSTGRFLLRREEVGEGNFATAAPLNRQEFNFALC
jgi:hypothetical protein